MGYSGIGGQAVMEGVMMKNEDRYAVAVRKPDHTIDVKVSTFKETIKNKKLRRLPFIRGVINFIESLILGMQTLMYSASFFEDDEDEKKKKEAMTQEERKAQEEKEKKQEKAMMGGTVAFSVVFALGLFFFLPYFLSGIFHKVIASDTVIALAEEFMVAPEKVEIAPQATTVDTVVQYRYDVPNIMTKINLLKLLLADKEVYTRVMIFTESKKNADRITDKLADFWKDELSVIHSNKAQNTRLNALKAFREGRARIMVASDVAARGLDIQDVSHVINFDIPTLAEEYVHRIGRTARAGKEGTAISLVAPREEDRFTDIERLIGQSVEMLPLPQKLEISDILLEEEKVVTANIVYQKKPRPKGGGAFHQKSAKNNKGKKK